MRKLEFNNQLNLYWTLDQRFYTDSNKYHIVYDSRYEEDLNLNYEH